MTKNEDIYRVTHTTFDREMTPRYVKENRRKKMEVNNPEKSEYSEDVYYDSFYEALAKSQAQYEKRFMPDSIVQKVQQEMNTRAEMGYNKYKQTLDRTDLSVIDYLQHAKEEAMDLALYLEKTIQMLKGNG
jgi:hypothetical protein